MLPESCYEHVLYLSFWLSLLSTKHFCRLVSQLSNFSMIILMTIELLHTVRWELNKLAFAVPTGENEVLLMIFFLLIHEFNDDVL